MKFLRIPAAIIITILICLLVYAIFPGPNQQNKKIYFAKSSRYELADKLKKNGIIRDKNIFWGLSQTLRFFGPLQSGEYEFAQRSSPLSILSKLRLGDVVKYNITIPEGLYTSQILKLVDQAPSLKGEVNNIFTEGELYPSTYEYKHGYTRMHMLIEMKTTMSMNLRSAWDRRAENLPFKDKYQALILASIVEKETHFDDERARVAAVFVNRLKKGMKLQADPTTIYAITQGKFELDRMLTTKDLKIKSPYNTYYTRGLPPSPICNPGIKSILAVLNPAKTKDLYFVLSPEGRHHFANNYADHKRNVAKYRKHLNSIKK